MKIHYRFCTWLMGMHSTLFRCIGSRTGPTKFRKSYTPNFCENFVEEKLLIFIKESTFLDVVKPRNGCFGNKNDSKYWFFGKFVQNPYFEPFLLPNHPFLGLATFRKVDSLMKMCNFSFIKFSQKLGV